MVAASLQPVMAQDNSPTNPAAVNTPVRSMVELGSVYTNIYDITITVLETVRGNEAMDRLKAASPDVKAFARDDELAARHVAHARGARHVARSWSDHPSSFAFLVERVAAPLR